METQDESVLVRITTLISLLVPHIGRVTPELELLARRASHLEGWITETQAINFFTYLLRNSTQPPLATLPKNLQRIRSPEDIINVIAWLSTQFYGGQDAALREFSFTFPLNALSEAMLPTGIQTKDFLTYRLTRLARRLYNRALSPATSLAELAELIPRARALQRESVDRRGIGVLGVFPSTGHQAQELREIDAATTGNGSRYTQETASRAYALFIKRAEKDLTCFMTDEGFDQVLAQAMKK